MLSSASVLARSLCRRCKNSESVEEASQYQAQAQVAIANLFPNHPTIVKKELEGCDRCYDVFNRHSHSSCGYLEMEINRAERR